MGQSREVTTDENVARIRELLQEYPRITLLQMAYILNILNERVHHILHNYSNARHICIKWVHHLLSADQMATRVKICRENLKIFENGGNHFIYRLVNEDEEIPKLAKREVHVKKIIYAIFFRSTSIVKIFKLGNGYKVTTDWYVKKWLSKVFESINEDRPKSGLTGIIMYHDNAKSHKTLVTTRYLDDNGVQLLTRPPYSPDLSPANFWLFKNLKKHLRGTVFNSKIDIDNAFESFWET
ncbi:histone-lysine N-methyltransferase SETMAR-like [Oppia nitens]|uniref:histone-lysine N-methyltransferase SETMAR-like n=1 Tax=Oppia nitens TaxID=1686743 RepID=UPI0023DBF9BB|nr:histone-lysine N-methyltransferase SETMAR-like [Oppia nitens]XP_054155978.1 histone-lysine N-methyltransferase SETMAR-like [Oppia nitens]